MNTGALDKNLREILDAVSDGVYVTTGEREIVFWSKGAERITGYSSDEVLNKHCHDNILVHTEVLGKNLCFDGCPLQKCIETGEQQEVKEVFLKRKDGERLAVYIKASVLQVGSGMVTQAPEKQTCPCGQSASALQPFGVWQR